MNPVYQRKSNLGDVKEWDRVNSGTETGGKWLGKKRKKLIITSDKSYIKEERRKGNSKKDR